ncbi:MAG: bifunctional 5,10-methylenetetrahydrofolate dehydrogenase/5,10-methenyltetrahydrofolate cyclohydrolase [Oscillospiraceae bacterium]
MINCVDIVNRRKENLRKYIQKKHLEETQLDIIQIGDNQASNSYIKGKMNDCKDVNIKVQLHKYPVGTTTATIISLIKQLSDNSQGIVLQLPAEGIDIAAVANEIKDDLDVDGFKPTSGYTSCTPKGIMILLDELNVKLVGKEVTIIGKSQNVGKPLIDLFLNRGATVTSCNSHTKSIAKHTKTADVIVCAVGKQNLLTKDMVNPNCIILDVGINQDENGKLCGDCDKELYDYVNMITPVPKGIGLLTRLALLENIIYNM